MMLAWFLIGLIMAFVVAVIAGRKGRSPFGWFIAGAVLWPVALIAILAVSKTAEAARQDAIESGEMRTCPHCAEMIRSAAKVCRYCGRDIVRSTATA